MNLHIRTPSRLHFGLLACRSDAGRSFGGAGLMIDEPAVEIVARRHEASGLVVTGSPSVHSSVVDRARKIASRLAEELGVEQGCAIEIRSCPPEHIGLGVGTQLAMAVGWAISRLADRSISLERLAELVGRGRRSAIGVHGFAHGGLLVDGGKGPRTKIAPLITRVEFPPEWPILLVTPPLPEGCHGPLEEDVFESLSMTDSTSARLSEQLVRHLLPSVLERDPSSFSKSLSDYNRIVGECFASVQGGVFAHPRVAEIVEWLRPRGVLAAQSSWGPTLFAVLDPANTLEELPASLATRFDLPTAAVRITFANNAGSDIREEASHGRN